MHESLKGGSKSRIAWATIVPLLMSCAIFILYSQQQTPNVADFGVRYRAMLYVKPDVSNVISDAKVQDFLSEHRPKHNHIDNLLPSNTRPLPQSNSEEWEQILAPEHIRNLSEYESASIQIDETSNSLHDQSASAYHIDNQSFLLTACTMVKNEAPYIVEWIEFNRMQGVDRIIIYDHNSSDNVVYLKDFYQQRDPGFQIQVYKSFENKSLYQNLQEMNFQHCLESFGNSTEWMVNLDVDEYLYSPAFGTLASMLRNLSAIERKRGLHFSGMTSVNLNFGSSGQQHRFENKLVRGADGRVTYRNPCGLQLITDHILRGPALNIFGESEEYQANSLCHARVRAHAQFELQLSEVRGHNFKISQQGSFVDLLM